MSEKKELYYLGTGTTFVKAQCKEYKTLEGALKAASKDESLVVWDEAGNVVGAMTDNVPDEALETNPDGSVNAYDAEGEKIGTVEAETVEEITGNMSQGNAEGAKKGLTDTEATNTSLNTENGANKENTASKEEKEDNEDNTGDYVTTGITKEEKGKFKVTVVCNGSLRLRRSASWDKTSECGRAAKGQGYTGKRIFMLDGIPMLETIDGLYMSAAAEHVKIERIG